MEAAPQKRKRRWYQFSLRALLIGVAIFSLVAAYVGSYCRLSRRGMHEAKTYGLEGFLYVPADEVVASHDLTRHHAFMVFYAPLNWLDREFFGGISPTGSIMWDLNDSSR